MNKIYAAQPWLVRYRLRIRRRFFGYRPATDQEILDAAAQITLGRLSRASERCESD